MILRSSSTAAKAALSLCKASPVCLDICLCMLDWIMHIVFLESMVIAYRRSLCDLAGLRVHAASAMEASHNLIICCSVHIRLSNVLDMADSFVFFFPDEETQGCSWKSPGLAIGKQGKAAGITQDLKLRRYGQLRAFFVLAQC